MASGGDTVAVISFSPLAKLVPCILFHFFFLDPLVKVI